MSYHEIETTARYRVRCRHCRALDGTKATFNPNDPALAATYDLVDVSAGEAERLAVTHIEDGDGDNYTHEVEITAYTLVGRNIS